MTQKVDILFVTPSADWETDQRNKIDARIEDGVSNQETPHIGIAYLLAAAKRDGIKAACVDMVAGGYSGDRLMEEIGRRRPALCGLCCREPQPRRRDPRDGCARRDPRPGARVCRE